MLWREGRSLYVLTRASIYIGDAPRTRMGQTSFGLYTGKRIGLQPALEAGQMPFGMLAPCGRANSGTALPVGRGRLTAGHYPHTPTAARCRSCP